MGGGWEVVGGWVGGSFDHRMEMDRQLGLLERRLNEKEANLQTFTHQLEDCIRQIQGSSNDCSFNGHARTVNGPPKSVQHR